MSKPTSGPWAVVLPNDQTSPAIVQGPPEVVWPFRIVTQVATVNRQGEQMEPNARLIAAAPDLFAACQAVARALDYANASTDPTAPNYANPVMVAADRKIAADMVRAAIAKVG